MGRVIEFCLYFLLIFSPAFIPSEWYEKVFTSTSIGYVGADGHEITLHNNESAVDPTYKQVIEFVEKDPTDLERYSSTFKCGDFAEKVHENAEAKGISCGWVAIDFSNRPGGHACNVFNTTDRGLIFIDCTSMDTKVTLIEGRDFIPEPLNSYSSVSFDTLGKVSSYRIYW